MVPYKSYLKTVFFFFLMFYMGQIPLYAQPGTEESFLLEPLPPVNSSYSYNMYDVNCFLQHRFDHTPWVTVVPGLPRVSGIGVEEEISKTLEQEKQRNGERDRFILMPYQDESLEWTSVVIVKDGRGFNGIFIPSLYEDEIPLVLPTIMHRVYGESFSFRELQGYYLLENHPEDLGLITLENLSTFGQVGSISRFPIASTLAFRYVHARESSPRSGGIPLFPIEGFYEFPERQYRCLPIIPYVMPRGELHWTQVLHYKLTLSPNDQEKLRNVVVKLGRISTKADSLPKTEDGRFDLSDEENLNTYNRFVQGTFLNIFDDLDVSATSPINFALQLRYKQIPGHLLSLHWWQSSPNVSTGVIDAVIQDLMQAGPHALSGFQSLIGCFERILRLEDLEEQDLYGLSFLKPFWEYRYVQEVLGDLTNRTVLIVDAEEVDTVSRRLGVLRLFQVSGEYLSKLKHIPAFKFLLKTLDLDGFRNIFSHLENLQHTIQRVLETTEINWEEIYREVCSFGTTLRNIQAQWNGEELSDPSVKWKHMKEVSAKLGGLFPLPLSFEHIKKLRKFLSEANRSLKKVKSSLVVENTVQISLDVTDDPTVQAKIQKMLSTKKIDKSDARSLHEFVEFIRTLHDIGIAFDHESFWEETTYPEILFHQMRGKSLEEIDTRLSKKEYRLKLLEQAITLLDWVRGLLGVDDIDLEIELAQKRLPDSARRIFPTSIIEKQVHFNSVPTPVTIKRIERFLEESPSGLHVLEFLIGAAYEALRPIFYFPELKKHYLQNMHVRNYYAHPDPTYLTPFVVWEAQGGPGSWDGRTIDTRPDRDDGFKKVLIQEASRLLVPLHHVLNAIYNRMTVELSMDEDLPEERRQEVRLSRYEYTPTDVAQLLSRLSENPPTEEYKQFSLGEEDEVIERQIHRRGNRYVLPPITQYSEQDPYQQLVEYLGRFYENEVVSVNRPTEIIVPFNPGGHWVTLRILLPEEGSITIEYIDSLHHSEKVINEAKATHVQERSNVVIDSLRGRFPDKEVRDVVDIRVPCKQPDSVSCGCVIIENIWKLFREEGLAEEMISKERMKDIRREHQEYLRAKGFDFDFAD